MATYTFIGIGHTGTIGTVDVAECPDDRAAIKTGRRLFTEAPDIRNWPTCRSIDIYEGSRLVHQVQRAAA